MRGGRGKRVWLLALAASLLLHLGVFGRLGDGLTGLVFRSDESPSFDVRLAARPPNVTPPSAPAAMPGAVNQRVASVRALPRSGSADVPVPAPETAAVMVEPVVEDVAPAAMIEAAAPATGSVVTPVEAVPPSLPLNTLPPRLEIEYAVHYGLASGIQSLLWVRDDARYTLTSVARASGLAGIFYRGEFGQTSAGRITPQGLQPETFRDQRGDHTSYAQFDVQTSQVHVQPAQGAPRDFSYTGTAQDALSLFFQLALTAPPPERVTHPVFNGKKLRMYQYEVRGEVMLDTALGALRTVHLVRAGHDDGRFEAWLAVDRHYLPVRMVRSDDKGNEMELRVRSMTP